MMVHNLAKHIIFVKIVWVKHNQQLQHSKTGKSYNGSIGMANSNDRIKNLDSTRMIFKQEQTGYYSIVKLDETAEGVAQKVKQTKYKCIWSA